MKGFNGAATFQSRKPKACAAVARTGGASMGPRPFSRGNRRYALGAHHVAPASMGPRPFSRGNRGSALSRSRCPHHASMGPRPFSRGNPLTKMIDRFKIPRFNGAATFQSRKPAAADRGWSVRSRLQWGRDLSVAETPAPPRPSSVILGFNGAATFQSRKRGPGRHSRPGRRVLQWGRDLSVAETKDRRDGRGCRASFNGAATFQSRKPTARCIRTFSDSCFNGAATFQSRKQ